MPTQSVVVCLFVSLALFCNAYRLNKGDEQKVHKHISRGFKDVPINPEESESSYWEKKGRQLVLDHLKVERTGIAKNVILFLGDGMSIPTLTAARAYIGQLQGKTGEETQLSFERFPVAGLSKTYCVDSQVADSACSATAYLGGVKGNKATIGVNAKVHLKNCEEMINTSNHVYSIAKRFLDDGRSAGLVTTTRVTHASPAGVYAHTANRDWEDDSTILQDRADPVKCRDIAHQLLYNEVGKQLKVILGCGREKLLPNNKFDEEGFPGSRSDGRNLIREWKSLKANKASKYMWNRSQLLDVDPTTEYLMGLFGNDHCEFNLKRNKAVVPSLEEMTIAAIKVLSKNNKGYFLFVEGGRIDHAHHNNTAYLAMDETYEFSKAIEMAVKMTDRSDTLIVVTSDHSHTLAYNGYSSRGNNILGVVNNQTIDDDKPFTTLSYANGPGYNEVNGKRKDPTKDPDFGKPTYRYPSMVPLDIETHGGDDVGVFALGPWQHLFTGNYEESSIPYFIEHAACLDRDKSMCKDN